MKTIPVDRDIVAIVQARAQPGESLGDTLRRELGVPAPGAAVEIDDETYAFIVSRARELGESASDILRRELGIGAVPPPAPGPRPAPADTISFRIPAGTGFSAWNSRDAAVIASVGRTLELVNDDDVAHRLHTAGAPFPHPANEIMPGESATFVLQSPYDPDLSGPLHDHSGGPGAEFWLRVLPGG